MALETFTIIDGKQILIPDWARSYSLDRMFSAICFDSEPLNGEIKLRTWKVPQGARTAEFRYYTQHGERILEAPTFYDREGNFLKTGNR
jgi:hypothetical protein